MSLIDCGPTVVTPSTPVAPYADGAWHMVTATWDKTAYATLYVDGVQKARVLDSGCYATNMQGVFNGATSFNQNIGCLLYTSDAADE